MEAVIREGALRLQTSEVSCDVILSCQGHRLMAHKVILSIASPMLRNLLVQDNTEPSVLIFPDINGNTMSLILDYVYTGSVVVYSNTITDFLNAATLLQLHIDIDCLGKYRHLKNVKMTKIVEKKDEDEIYSRINRRKLPNLVPLSKLGVKTISDNKTKEFKRMSNCVIPSPWCPRIMPLLSDPRTDCSTSGVQLNRDKLDENDANNNSPARNIYTSSLISSATIQSDETCSELDLTTSLHRLAFQPQKTVPRIFQTNHGSFNNINSRLAGDVITKEKKIKKSNRSTLLATLQNNLVEFQKKIDNATITKKTTSSLSLPPLDLANGDGAEEDDNHKRLILPDAIKKENDNDRHEDEPKQKPFKCDDCGKCFSQLRNYKYHRSVHEGTKEFAAKCPECGKLFNDRGYLSSHMKIHRDKKEYACPHCPKRFNQRVAYNMHLRIHTGIKPHECATCGKSFSRKMLLKQHQRVHTGERPYSCPECGKTFADRSNMSLHARLHTGVKPYACNLCPKSFTKKHHLKTHMNFHTGLKPYTCLKCGLAFSQSSNMRTHYKKCILKDSLPDRNGNVGSIVLLENTDSNNSNSESETK